MDSASSQPGCLLALVSLAQPMAADVQMPVGEGPAAIAARYVLDLLIDGLAAAGDSAGELEIGIYGYRSTDAGLSFEWLLPTPEPDPKNGPLARFESLLSAEVPCRVEGQPRKWIERVDPTGEAKPVTALGRAYCVLAWWAARHADGRPPVFIHCATADGFDALATATMRAIRALSVPAGPVRVLEWIFKPGEDAGFPADDIWNMLFSEATPQQSESSTTGPAFVVEREFWSAKRGNEPGMWEDAYAIGPCGTVVAVCDGASDGIFARGWAQRMAQQFVNARPDLSRRTNLVQWITSAREEWRNAINYPKLRLTQQIKVDDVGAAATLIGLEFDSPDAEGLRRWKSTSVGDACLFQIRSADEWLSFPIVAADQFTSAPSLLRTKKGLAPPPVSFATGTCRPGDLFLLATDAVSARLISNAADGPIDWERYSRLEPEEWQAEFDLLRDSGKLVNDDCTLLVLRVAPAISLESQRIMETELVQDGFVLTPMGDSSNVETL